MKGFCDYGFILFPRLSVYEAMNDLSIGRLKDGISKVVKYMENEEIELYALSTDESAECFIPNNVNIKFINSILPEDMNYLNRHLNCSFNCELSKMVEPFVDEIREKYPTERGMSEDDRIELINKRIDFIQKKIFEKVSLIVNIDRKTNSQYKLKSKEDDEKILIEIDPDSLIPIVKMSGSQMSAEALLGEGKSFAIINWEV